MILRRITEHVKAQNWTAVALDFVIVVMGVFIGIQVANWNAARQDKADEKLFLQRLHGDIVRVEISSARLRTRRINSINDLSSGIAKVFGDDPESTLTDAECLAFSTSHYYNINVFGLPSLVELTNAGRVGILRNRELSTALVEFQQRSELLSEMVRFDPAYANNLIMLDPDLLQVEPIFDTQLGEYQTYPTCDLDAMRRHAEFKNAVTENLDGYDAYLRDGLLPWNEQLLEIHRIVDASLNIRHPKGAE